MTEGGGKLKNLSVVPFVQDGSWCWS